MILDLKNRKTTISTQFQPKNTTIPQLLVCNDGESNECSDKQWLDVSISDHLHYFDKVVSGYGSDGCVDEPQKS
jgi:hypothetical protein